MFRSVLSKNGVRDFLDRKQLSVAQFSEQTGLPEALVVALYDDVRLMPTIEASAGFLQGFPGEDPNQMMVFEPEDPEASIQSVVPNGCDGPLQVTVCGGGNLGHVFTGLLGARDDVVVHVLVSEATKANHLQKAMGDGGIVVKMPTGEVVGRPALITSDPSVVIPGSRLILLCVPSHVEVDVLNRVLPHVDDDVYIGSVPAPGGFDWKAEHALKQHNKTAVVFGMGAIPWMCKVAEYGRVVNVLGSKLINLLSVMPSERTVEVAEVMGHLLQTPVVDLQHFLHMTLHPGNQLLHPGIMYEMFGNWDGAPLLEPPLFYEGVSDAAADLLQQLSDELLILRGALEAQIPNLHLPFVLPLHTSIVYGYGKAVRDPSSLRSAIATNTAYAGIRTPMVQKEGGWVPDWNSRFFWEDIPHGLVVLRGLADLASVSLPVMDQVLLWAQDQMGCSYLVDGRLDGRDVVGSGAPKCYGITRVDDLIAD